jgi:hypothetical protein
MAFEDDFDKARELDAEQEERDVDLAEGTDSTKEPVNPLFHTQGIDLIRRSVSRMRARRAAEHEHEEPGDKQP